MTARRGDAQVSRASGNLRTLLTAWAFSLSGDGLRVVALPLLALAVTGSALGVAVVAIATTLPWLLVALPAGALVDRSDPRRILQISHLARAAVTAALVAAVISGLDGPTGAIVLAVGGFLVTTCETFADAASQSLLVAIVPTEGLERANARYVTVETIALDLIGPLGAGVLYLLGGWVPLAVSSVGFVVAAVLAGRLPSVTPVPSTTHWRRDLVAGGRMLFRSSILRLLVVTVAIMVIANASTDAMLVVYATESLHFSEALFPTLLAAYSVGVLAAAVLVGRLSDRFRQGVLMVAAMIAIAATMVAMGWFVSPVVAWVSYAVMGLAGGTWNVLSATRRQRHTPRGAVARVSSAFRVIAWGFIPVGSALGGTVAHHWGAPAVFLSGGILILVLAAVVGRWFLAPEPSLPATKDGSGVVTA